MKRLFAVVVAAGLLQAILPASAEAAANPQASYYDTYCTRLGWVETSSVFWASSQPTVGGTTSSFRVTGANQTIVIYAVPPKTGQEDSWCWFWWKGGAAPNPDYQSFDGWALITPQATAVAEPRSGYLVHLNEGRVWFARANPAHACYTLRLIVGFGAGTAQSIAYGGQPTDVTYAWADYWATNECAGGGDAGPHLTGSVTLRPDQFSLDGLNSATLTDVAIPVSAQGFSQLLNLELALTATSGPIAWNVHNGILLPPGGAGIAPWGERHNERYVTADATASVTDLTYRDLFTTDDVLFGEIGEFVQIWR